jgi:signal transduction histidine kinase
MNMPVGLKARWILATTFLVSFVSIIAGVIFAGKVSSTLNSQFSRRIHSIADNVASISVYGILTENRDILGDMIKRVLEEDEIVAIRIENEQGQVLVAARSERRNLENSVQISVPVSIDTRKEVELGGDLAIYQEPESPGPALPARQVLGRIAIDFSRRDVDTTLRLMFGFIGLITLLLIGTGGILGFFLANRILRPISSLVAATERVARGDLASTVTVQSRDELAALAASFNMMTASLRQSQEELKVTYAELAKKERLAALGQLTAGIAHEIRNPLSTILTSAQIVANPARKEATRIQAAGLIVSEAQRLNDTLTNFLKFARPREPIFQKCSLEALINKVVMVSQLDSNSPAAEIRTEIAPNLPELWGDPDQIHQVLLNLVLNARQAGGQGGQILIRATLFTPADSSEIITNWPSAGSAAEIPCLSNVQSSEIRQRLQRHPHGFFLLEVRDNGQGISPEHFPKIFEPFFSTKESGTGLGLPIVYQIIRMHQGEIWAMSRPGEGSRFMIVLDTAGKI